MKKWWMRILLIIDATLAALLLCEIIIRLTYGGLVVTASLVRRDPAIGTRLIAGARGRATCSSYRIAYAINKQGLRDEVYLEQKPEGTFRILVLGDSFVFGHGVEQDEVFTEVAEKELRAKGLNVEIINAGVFNYGTDNELLWFKELRGKFRPDLVFLLVFPNDCTDNLSHGFYSLSPDSRDGNLSDLKVQFDPERLRRFAAEGTPADRIPLYRSVLVKLHLAHFLAGALGLRPVGLPVEYPERVNPDAFRPAALGRKDISEGTLLTAALINEIKRSSDVPVVVGLARNREAYYTSGRAFEELRWALEDMTEWAAPIFEFKEEPIPGLVFIAGGIHWNPEGHRRAAGILVDSIGRFIP